MVYVIFFALVVAGLGSLICAGMAAYYLVKISAMSGEEVQAAYDSGTRWPHQWIRYVGTPQYHEGMKMRIVRRMAQKRRVAHKRIGRIALDRYGRKSVYLETVQSHMNAYLSPTEAPSLVDETVGPPEHYYGPWRLDKGI